MNHHPSVWITHLSRAEMANAVSRYAFRGHLSSAEAQKHWDEFEYDCKTGVWIHAELPGQIWETSIDLARKYGPALGVRTLDSLHVACALGLRAQRFWTFDDRQARLAEAVGLDTTP